MNASREIHFHDSRPPHAIRCELEREMMMLFQPVLDASGLSYRASGKVNGVPCHAELQFSAATLLTNHYTYRLEADGIGLSAEALARNGSSLAGWFDLWTRHYTARTPPVSRDPRTDRYKKMVAEAVGAEAHLGTVADVQRTIVDALRQGACFSTAHKEGGSNIRFDRGRFECADYGESDQVQEFHDEAAFLVFLRKFYHWETARNSPPEKLSELQVWKLILRLLRWDRKPPATRSTGGSAGGSGVGPPVGMVSRAVTPATADDAAARAAKATAFYRSLSRMRLWAAGVVLVLGLGAALVFGLGSRLLTVKTIGSPTGQSVRTRTHIATLITRVEPYVPSLHHRPETEQRRLDLLLHPLDGKSPRQLVSIARRIPSSAARNGARLLGADGEVLWLVGRELNAFDFRTMKLISTQDLRRINPMLGELLENGDLELDGHLRLSSHDNQHVYEFDPATFQAVPGTRPRRSGWRDPSAKPEEFLCAGARWSSSNWFGAHSAAQLQRDFKPRTSLSKDYPVERSKERRQLYRGQLETTGNRSAVVSMEVLSPEEIVGASLVRESRGGGPLKLTVPDGFLVTSLSQTGATEMLVILRVDLTGRILWKCETGLTVLDQILPDARSIAFIGRKPAPSGKVPPPALVIVDNASGVATTHSLWVSE